MEWLSDSVEALIDELKESSRRDPDCDALVIGSGYGGAVAALRLAQKGVKVWLLERGRERLPGEFPRDWSHLVGDVRIDSHGQAKVIGRPDALFDVRAGKDVAAVLGNALGGGSQINAGVVIEADPRVFDREPWPRVFRDNAALLKPYYQRARDMLAPAAHPGPMPPKSATLGRLAPHLQDYVAKHWAAGAPVRFERPEIAVNFEPDGPNKHQVEQKKCVDCGDCVTGCNYGAKNTLTMNYLPLAQRAGARLFTGATVLGVEPIFSNDRLERWRVHYRRTAEEKDALPQAHHIDAKVVVLAAGTFGSTEILLRSTRQYPLRLSPCLGRRFSCNGDLIAAGYDIDRPECESLGGVHGEAAVKPGPTISGMIDLRAAMHPGRGVLIQDAAIPGPLVKLFGELITTAAVPAQLVEKRFRGDTGARESDPLAVSAERLRKTQVYLAMGEDEASGVLRLEDAPEAELGRARCWVHWPGASRQSAYRATTSLLKLCRKLGGLYLDNPAAKPFSDEMARALTGPQPVGPAITVHPLGGCAMADDVRHGVVDHAGRVFDPTVDPRAGAKERPDAEREARPKVHDGLYVMDGAIVPGAIGANPLFTIAALAERAVELLIERHFGPHGRPGKGEAREQPAPSNPDPTPAREEPVAFRFSERMDGELAGALPQLDGAAGRPVSLEVEYRVEDVDAWLRDPVHGVPASGELVLRAPGAHRTFALQGRLELLVREPAHPWWRRARALWHWFRLRGAREIWRRVRDREPIDPKMVCLLWRMAPHVGERRFMRYELKFAENGQMWSLSGTKTIQYSRHSNLWNSLCDLEARLRPEGAEDGARGTLSLDFVDLVRHRLPQIVRQSDEPSGVLALARAALWLTRVMFQAHFWSFDAPDYEPREKFRRRYPDELADRAGGERMKPERHWILPGKKGAWQPLDPSARQGDPVLLSRYRNAATREKKDAPPVLLFHGFAHSGLVFATDRIDENLVQHLCARGFDVWVAELRTSIALESSWRQWSFDRIAEEDVPSAVDYVLERTKPSGRALEEHRIKVVAHCMGSAVFSMAALSGWLEHKNGKSKVEAAVLAQIAPLLRGSRSNELRANQAVFLRDALSLEHVNAAVDDSVDWRGAIADRVAMTYPLPAHEASHHAMRPCERRTDLANCNRNSALFGRQWVHGNLDRRSHENLGELLAHANMTTFAQIAHFIELGRLVDAEGANVYVRGKNIAQHMNFPILFLHAKDTDVFDPETSRRSYQVFRRINTRTYYEHRLIEGYGHFDSLIGRHAHRDVFPRIAAFLEREDYEEKQPRRPLPPLAKPPRLGPIVGWTRPDPRQPGEAGTAPLVRLWIKVDDGDVHPAKRVYVAVLRGRGQNWDARRLVRGSMRDWEIYKVCGERIAVEDLALPDDRDDYWVLFASAHVPVHGGAHVPLDLALKLSSMQDLSGYIAGSSLDFEFDDIERKDVEALLASLETPQRAEFLVGLKKLGHALLWQWRSALAKGEGAFLSGEMLQRVLHRQEEIALVFGSCRYPGSPFERERSDEIFRQVLEQTVDGGPEPKPSAFLMVGDQIYADATAGMFDVAAPRERYVRAYDQAFGSPNLRALMQRIPTYMAADDHEIANDWEKWTPRDPRSSAKDKDDRLHEWADQAFRCHQWYSSPRNSTGGSNDKDRPLWYSFKSSEFGFFVMDTRFERERARDVFPGQFMKPEQFTELKSWLSKQQRQPDPARPKFVACGSVVAPFQRANAAHRAYRRRDDSWYRYEDALNELIRHIGENKIENVVFLCGDFHVSLATEMRYERNGVPIEGLRSWCIVSSPFYAPLPFVNGRCADYVQDSRADGKTQRDPHSGIAMDYEVREHFEGDNFTRVHAFERDGRWWLRVQFYDRAGRMRREKEL